MLVVGLSAALGATRVGGRDRALQAAGFFESAVPSLFHQRLLRRPGASIRGEDSAPVYPAVGRAPTHPSPSVCPGQRLRRTEPGTVGTCPTRSIQPPWPSASGRVA